MSNITFIFGSFIDRPHICWNFFLFLIAVPSGSPGNFTMNASSSTSITSFWQLPPSDSRNGIIIGFKLFYKRKSSDGPPTIITINNGTSSVKDITGLAKYTEYECQVLAFTSVGDGPKSSSEITRTKEDGKKWFYEDLLMFIKWPRSYFQTYFLNWHLIAMHFLLPCCKAQITFALCLCHWTLEIRKHSCIGFHGSIFVKSLVYWFYFKTQCCMWRLFVWCFLKIKAKLFFLC